MKSDTSAWMPEGQNCCSRSSPNAKNAPRSRAPPTPPSANGAPPAPTRAWPRPSSTDSPSTPTSSTPAPTPTGSEPPEQRTEAPPSKKPPSPTPPPRHRAPAEPQKKHNHGWSQLKPSQRGQMDLSFSNHSRSSSFQGKSGRSPRSRSP